jgi:thymidine phosphorylase
VSIKRQLFIRLLRSIAGLKKIDAELIGCASVLLGAGRRKAEDTVGYSLGISGIKKIGEKVGRNEPLLIVHARGEKSLTALLPFIRTGCGY